MGGADVGGSGVGCAGMRGVCEGVFGVPVWVVRFFVVRVWIVQTWVVRARGVPVWEVKAYMLQA